MINNKIYLIGPDYVKNNSPVMQNVEDQFIESGILEAQNIEYQNVICDIMYDKMIEQYDDYRNHVITGGTQPITDFVEQRFIDLNEKYGYEIIKYYTLYHSSFALQSKLANKGIVNQHSNNSDNVSDNFMYDLRKNWKNIADNYVIKLTSYISGNTDLYPEWLECNENCDNDSINNKSNSTGLYLGKFI